MIEIWVNALGDIIETERNPCGCHPDDYIITRIPVGFVKKVVSLYWPSITRSDFLAITRERSWEKIDTVKKC